MSKRISDHTELFLNKLKENKDEVIRVGTEEGLKAVEAEYKDMLRLSVMFFENLERDNCEYGGWGVDDKRPFGNSFVSEERELWQPSGVYRYRNLSQNFSSYAIIIKMTKVCTFCKQEKPITEFGWKYKKKNKREAWCIPCRTIKRREYKNKKRKALGLPLIQPKSVYEPDFISKVCTKCGKDQPREMYYVRKQGIYKNKAYPMCKECFVTRARTYYHKTYKYNRKATSELPNTVRLRIIKQAILAIIKNKPCMDCGEIKHFRAMEFDHITEDKIENIAIMTGSNLAIDKIFDEISKCELVCSNCHRLRTIKRDSRNVELISMFMEDNLEILKQIIENPTILVRQRIKNIPFNWVRLKSD